MDAAPTSLDLLPAPTAGRVWVAFSGGRDSTVLLHWLKHALPADAALHAIHVHHGLQAEADAWAAHCRALCADWKTMPLPDASAAQRAAGSSDFEWMDALIFLVFAIPMLSGLLRGMFGNKLGTLFTGVGAGALALGYGHIEFRDTELLKREAALA